jgi:hypothetical protein
MTPQEELAALRRLAELEAKAATAEKQQDPVGWGGLESFGHGMLQGLGDEVMAAGGALRGLYERKKSGWDGDTLPALGEEYSKAAAAIRGSRDKYRTENPVASFATEAAGSMATGIPAGMLAMPVAAAPTVAKTVLQSAVLGAGQGGVYGFNEGEGGVVNRLQEGGKGAALGGLVGAVVPAAASGVGAGWRAVTRPIADRLGPEGAAQRQILKALEDHGMTLEQAKTRLGELGPDATLADIIPNYAELVANSPGKGIAASQALQGRMEGQGQRIISSVDQNLSGGDRIATAAELRAERAGAAAPLYDAAFQGGSTAPLETQLTAHFQAAAKAAGEAASEVQQASQALLVAQAKKATTSDVYALNGILQEERQAAQRLAAAQQAAQEAESVKTSVLDRLRTSQNDAATDAPGAIWSPRVQQFIDDPIAKSGLARGMEIQRLEALAQGRRFNPMELAITGVDNAGMPIVDKVPNLRTLDAIKRGLDDTLEQYRDKMTGRLVLDERGRAIEGVRKSLVSELDRLTGGAEGPYAQARASWAGPSQSMDAIARGNQFGSTDPRVLAEMVAKMSPSDQGFFRIGVADKVREIVSRVQDGADATRRLFGNDRVRAQLRAVFPDEASFAAFQKDMEREALFAKTRNQVTGNSRTAYRTAGQDELGIDPAGPAANLVMGNFGSAATDAARQLASFLKRPPRSVADQAAAPLFAQGDKSAILQALGSKAKAAELTESNRAILARLLSSGAASAGGVEVGR